MLKCSKSVEKYCRIATPKGCAHLQRHTRLRGSTAPHGDGQTGQKSPLALETLSDQRPSKEVNSPWGTESCLFPSG